MAEFHLLRRGVQVTRGNGVAYETVLCGMRWMQLPSVMRAHRAVRWSELTERINWKGLPKERCVLPAGARRGRREAGGRRVGGRHILRNSLMKYGICENRLLWELHKVNPWRKSTRMLMQFWSIFFVFFIFYCQYCTKSILAAASVTRIQGAGITSFSILTPF